jgi:hypothetical protein
VVIWINQTLGAVRERDVRRIFRNGIGEQCAEVVVAGRIRIEVLDYEPSIALLRRFRNSVTDCIIGRNSSRSHSRPHLSVVLPTDGFGGLLDRPQRRSQAD